MSKVIVIDLVGDDEAVKAESISATEKVKRDVLHAPAARLMEVAFDEAPAGKPDAYRALLLRYFRR